MKESLISKLQYLKEAGRIAQTLESDISNLIKENLNFFKINKDLEKLITEKSHEISAFKNELESSRNVLQNSFEKDINSDHNQQPTFTLGINNLSVRNSEAIHDALSFFEKKCPYCNNELFQTTHRKQFEIDHFFPVVRGGQDLPWNILPVCQSCNRKKKDTLPHNFLNFETFKKVNTYLESVHKKYLDESIDSYTFKEKLNELIDQEVEFLRKNINSNFVSNLLYLSDKQNIVTETSIIVNAETIEFVDDENTIQIIEYLNKLIPTNWNALNIVERKKFLNISTESQLNQQLTQRKFVCIAEIWTECFGKNFEDMNRYETRNINSVLKKLKNWRAVNSTKNFPIYGIQRFYERI